MTFLLRTTLAIFHRCKYSEFLLFSRNSAILVCSSPLPKDYFWFFKKFHNIRTISFSGFIILLWIPNLTVFSENEICIIYTSGIYQSSLFIHWNGQFSCILERWHILLSGIEFDVYLSDLPDWSCSMGLCYLHSFCVLLLFGFLVHSICLRPTEVNSFVS